MSEATSAAVEAATCGDCDSNMSRTMRDDRTHDAAKISYALRCDDCGAYGVIHITEAGTIEEGSVDLSEYGPRTDDSEEEADDSNDGGDSEEEEVIGGFHFG